MEQKSILSIATLFSRLSIVDIDDVYAMKKIKSTTTIAMNWYIVGRKINRDMSVFIIQYFLENNLFVM